MLEKLTRVVEHVERVSRRAPSRADTEPEDEPSEREKEHDDSMAVDDDFEPPARAKPKRKPKKEIPVGKNGLKKRRVVKQRMTLDAKGYMGKCPLQ